MHLSHCVHTVAQTHDHVYKVVALSNFQLFHREIATHTESKLTPHSTVAHTHNISVKSHTFVFHTPHTARVVS